MTIDKNGKGRWKYNRDIGRSPIPEQIRSLREDMKTVQKELLAGKAAHDLEARNELAPEEEKPRRVLVQPLVKGIIKYRNQDVEVENLKGIIRRLEKSNQELGMALHKCQNPGEAKGWD